MWRPCEDMPQIVALATSKSAAVLRRGSLAHPTVPVILVLAGEVGEWLRGLRAKKRPDCPSRQPSERPEHERQFCPVSRLQSSELYLHYCACGHRIGLAVCIGNTITL